MADTEGERASVSSQPLPVPEPVVWTRVFLRLKEAREQNQITNEPPAPLILAGAAFSNASDIRSRWHQLVQWAQCHELTKQLLDAYEAPADNQDVAETLAGVSEDGRNWWTRLEDEADEEV